ncbi:polysaccharide deacetylase, partial [mine drainage metagenome]
MPATASAVVVNLTAAGGTSASFLTAYAAGSTRPLGSNLNFPAGETVANRATVAVGTGGQIEVYNHTGTVNVDVDVDGYFTGTAGAPGSAFFPVTPVRLTDTRSSMNGTPMTPNSTEKFALTNSVIPAAAAAVQTNITVVPGTAAGFLTVYPISDSTVPVASDVNWVGTTLPPATAEGIPNVTI